MFAPRAVALQSAAFQDYVIVASTWSGSESRN